MGITEVKAAPAELYLASHSGLIELGLPPLESRDKF